MVSNKGMVHTTRDFKHGSKELLFEGVPFFWGGLFGVFWHCFVCLGFCCWFCVCVYIFFFYLFFFPPPQKETKHSGLGGRLGGITFLTGN